VSMVLWPPTQMALSQSTLTLPWVAFDLCDRKSDVRMVNNAVLNFKGSMQYEFAPSNAVLSTAEASGNSTEESLGVVSWLPDMSLSPGNNSFFYNTWISDGRSVIPPGEEFHFRDMFFQRFLKPMFEDGKKMKLIFDVKKMTLVSVKVPFPKITPDICDSTFIDFPTNHMRKVLICQAKCRNKSCGQSCGAAEKTAGAPPEAVKELDQMADLVEIAGRRLQAPELGHYEMECIDDGMLSGPSVVV